MAERMTSIQVFGYYEGVLKNAAVAYKGAVACWDTSDHTIKPAADASATLEPLGTFEETKTGDGTVTVRVKLAREVTLCRFKNDGTAPVAAANLFTNCYFTDDRTVSSSSNSNARSVAGKAWLVDSDGVWVSVAVPV